MIKRQLVKYVEVKIMMILSPKHWLDQSMNIFKYIVVSLFWNLNDLNCKRFGDYYMENIIYAGLRPSTFSLKHRVSFCMFRTHFLNICNCILIFESSQSVILLEVSSDLRLSWSVSRLSIENRHGIEIATNTHEYL